MRRLLLNPALATVVAIGLVVVGATIATRTAGGPDRVLGALALGLCAAAGGAYIGSTALHAGRRRR